MKSVSDSIHDDYDALSGELYVSDSGDESSALDEYDLDEDKNSLINHRNDSHDRPFRRIFS